MADCKTIMYRRKSGDTLPLPGAGGCRAGAGSGTRLAATGNNGNCNGTTTTNNNNIAPPSGASTSGSSSYQPQPQQYHFQHQHQQQQQQQYQNHSPRSPKNFGRGQSQGHTPNDAQYFFPPPGFGPPPPHSPQPAYNNHSPHPPDFSFHPGGGAATSGGPGSPGMEFPHESPMSPPRPWIQLAHPKHKRTCLTVLCYNILCSRYASSTLYSYCPQWALDWNYRRKAILQELLHYAPDIISLQEMETDQFYNYFLPQLQSLGYSGIFGAKSRARTMVESKRKLVDGCAIFYRTNKFRLLSEHLIEFGKVAMENATRCERISEEMLNRVQTKDNIALAALFETKPDSERDGSLHGLVTPRPRPLLVCTCHIHWDPNHCDVKLVQTMMLMQELRKIIHSLYDPPDLLIDPLNDPNNNSDLQEPQSPSSQNRTRRSGSSSSSSTASSISNDSIGGASEDSKDPKVNLLICGDFNSLPQSGVVQYMQGAAVSATHPDFKGLSYEGYLDSPSIPDDPLPEDFHFHHDFHLRSVYPQDSMPFTNYTLEFQGVIDYIFHSARGLRPLGILGPLDSTWLVQHNIVGAPHPSIPSDHLPLLVELEMIPAI